MGAKFVSNMIQIAKLSTISIVLFIAACTNGPAPQTPLPSQPLPALPQVRAPSPPAPAYVGCANSGDMRAVKTAAIGQRLMVASHACHAIDSYKNFVSVYRDELRASDFALQDFFDRLDGEAGERAYDTFKTRLANSAMLDSLGDTEGYCKSTNQAFSTAMSLPSRELELFMLTQDFALTEKVSPCNITSARHENSRVTLATDAER
jgi:hypothetical protein